VKCSRRLRAFDDRLELFLGSAQLEPLPRGRAPDGGRGAHAHVIDDRHVNYSLRAKPQAFANLIYRDALFPRTAYRRCSDALAAALPLRRACRIMVDLLWLAQAQAWEAGLAVELYRILMSGDLPDPAALQTRFAAGTSGATPCVAVHMPTADAHDGLTSGRGAAA
jgi:hypothetical protein